MNRIQNNGTLEITSFSPLSPKSIHFPLFLSRYLPLLVPGSVNLEYVVYSDCRRPVSVSLICLRNTCIHGVTKLHDREKGRKKRRIAEGWRRRSVCSSREEILARTISTRLTKLAKYLGAFSSSRFLFPFAYFCVQSSTLAPLLTSSLSFVLSVFLPIVLVFLLVCVYVFFCLSLLCPPHSDCVRAARKLPVSPSLGIPPAQLTAGYLRIFEVLLVSSCCLYVLLCFSSGGFSVWAGFVSLFHFDVTRSCLTWN